MPTEVDRHRVEHLLEEGAQLVDVLEQKEFAASHLPGAINIPLAEIPEVAPRSLDPGRPVVVYCYDSLCDLSPRAAHRLESLGFDDVYDYVGSKMEWIGSGLPFEGAEAKLPLLATLAHASVPTCRMDAPASSLRFDEWDMCVVTDDGGVVLGIVDADELRTNDQRSAVELMREAPSTYRPHVKPEELLSAVKDDKRPVLVTRLDGTILGAIPVDELLAAVDD